MGQHDRGKISNRTHLGSPQCGEHKEPRRTDSLKRKSNPITMPQRGETAGYRDTHLGARGPDRPQRTGGHKGSAWAHTRMAS